MLKYNLFLFCAWLFIIPAAIVRLYTKKDTLHTLKSRFSIFKKLDVHNETIWCHAASVGEFNTLETLIPDLKKHFKNHDILLTVSNIIAYEQAKIWADENTYIKIAPLDFPVVLKRFINYWNPVVLLTMENEIFPNRVSLLKKTKCKIIWVNARISKKSITFWEKNSKLKDHTIKNIDYIFAQDKSAYQRFKNLGFDETKLTQTDNLKKFRSPSIVNIDHIKEINHFFPYQDTICIASSHPGEEALILEAYEIALRNNSNLKMILVPRHPKRMKEISSQIDNFKFKYLIRSQNQTLGKDTQIYLADTIGELPLWYSSCSITFIAGSLLPIGGHTPYEPTLYSSAIIHGQYFSNFEEIYDELDKNRGAIKVTNPKELAAAWEKLKIVKFREQTLSKAKSILLKVDEKEKLINSIIYKLKP
ncbi:hypothetical protein OAB14_01955 [Amylibacter sp.]|nr:hypothetical protein [Amylibacter sp.]